MSVILPGLTLYHAKWVELSRSGASFAVPDVHYLHPAAAVSPVGSGLANLIRTCCLARRLDRGRHCGPSSRRPVDLQPVWCMSAVCTRKLKWLSNPVLSHTHGLMYAAVWVRECWSAWRGIDRRQGERLSQCHAGRPVRLTHSAAHSIRSLPAAAHACSEGRHLLAVHLVGVIKATMPRKTTRRSSSTGSIGESSGSGRGGGGGGNTARRGVGKRSNSSRRRHPSEPTEQDVARAIRESNCRVHVSLELAVSRATDLAWMVQDFQDEMKDRNDDLHEISTARIPLLECGVKDLQQMVELERIVARQQRPTVQDMQSGEVTEVMIDAEAVVQHDSKHRDVYLALVAGREAENLVWKFTTSLRLQLQSVGVNARALLPPHQIQARLTPEFFQSDHQRRQKVDRERFHWSGKLPWVQLSLTTVRSGSPSTVVQRTFLPAPSQPPLNLRYPELETIVKQLLRENLGSGVPIVIILRGIPGSGKSMLTREIEAVCRQERVRSTICSADHLFETPRGYIFDVQKLGRAHDTCKDKFVEAITSTLRKRQDATTPQHIVVVDNTHTQLWEYEPYSSAASKYGCKVTVLEMRCPDVSTAHRMGLRNSHGVAPGKVVSMFLRWEEDPTAHCFAPQFADAPLTMNPVTTNDVNGKVVYVGIFLDEAARAKLLTLAPAIHQNVTADHITVFYRPDDQFMRGVEVGQVLTVRCKEVVQDSCGQAVRIELDGSSTLQIRNKVPHITISTANGVSSSYSNEVLESKTAERVPIEPELELLVTLGFAMITQNRRVITTNSPFAFSDVQCCLTAPPGVSSAQGGGDAAVNRSSSRREDLCIVYIDDADFDEIFARLGSSPAEALDGSLTSSTSVATELFHHMNAACTTRRVLCVRNVEAATTAVLESIEHLGITASRSQGIFDEVISIPESNDAQTICDVMKSHVELHPTKQITVLTTSAEPHSWNLTDAVDPTIAVSVIGLSTPDSFSNGGPQQISRSAIAAAMDQFDLNEQEHTRHQVHRMCRLLSEASSRVLGSDSPVVKRIDSTVTGLSVATIDLVVILPSTTDISAFRHELISKLFDIGVHCAASRTVERLYAKLCSSFSETALFRIDFVRTGSQDKSASGNRIARLDFHDYLVQQVEAMGDDSSAYSALVPLVRALLVRRCLDPFVANECRFSSYVTAVSEQLVVLFVRSHGCPSSDSVKSGQVATSVLRLVGHFAEWKDEKQWADALAPVHDAFVHEEYRVSDLRVMQELQECHSMLKDVDIEELEGLSHSLEPLSHVLRLFERLDEKTTVIARFNGDGESITRVYAELQHSNGSNASALQSLAFCDFLRELATVREINPTQERLECGLGIVANRVNVISASTEVLVRVQKQTDGELAQTDSTSPFHGLQLAWRNASDDKEML